VTRFCPECVIGVVTTGKVYVFTLYMDFLDFVGFQRGFICSFNGILGAPRGALKVQKWTSDVYPVNIGRLDYYVVFGTKSGAIQDF